MIRRINIRNFGAYRGFDWECAFPSAAEKEHRSAFGRLNILYGRNYSGKTTLSQIVRAFELGGLPEHYGNPDFSVTFDDGQDRTHRDVEGCPFNVRVFNRDFVRDHLGFLVNDRGGGGVSAFAVLGAANIGIRDRIAAKRLALEGSGGSTGARGAAEAEEVAAHAAEAAHLEAVKKLKNSHSQRVNRDRTGLKLDRLLGLPRWTERHLAKHLEGYRGDEPDVPSADEAAALRSRLDAPDSAPVASAHVPMPPMSEMLEATNALLRRGVTDSEEIRELAAEAALQTWVGRGLELHAEREDCGFCGSPLTDARRAVLHAHFSKELTELTRELKAHRDRLRGQEERIASPALPDPAAFLPTHQTACREACSAITEAYAACSERVRRMREATEARLADPLHALKELESASSADLQVAVEALHAVVERNNLEVGSQDAARKQDREALLELTIADYFHQSRVAEAWADIDQKADEAGEARSRATTAAEAARTLQREIQVLESQLSDQAQAAERINGLLGGAFGLQHIRLIPTGEGGDAFEIRRGEAVAFNLSEGERSLIAFCYFMVRLEEAGGSAGDLIVFVDDPMSSLDANQVFFIHSLIASRLAQNLEGVSTGTGSYVVRQLFVSTHSLEMLRFSKRLKSKTSDRTAFPASRHVLVEATEGGSTLRPMPDHLRLYATEFVYLFDQIRCCCDDTDHAQREHHFYNLGNNLRRFLEMVLFFKFPSAVDDGDHNRRIDLFFGTTDEKVALVERLINEFSHAGGNFEASTRPIDAAELTKTALFVMEKLRENDPTQYEHLVACTGGDDPLAGVPAAGTS